MKALTGERLSGMIETAREKCVALEPSKLADLDENMAVEFSEHFEFQQLQAQAHVQGILTPEAAQIVYASLGEVGSSENGGWAAGTDTATKVIVTQLMSELLRLKLAKRGVVKV